MSFTCVANFQRAGVGVRGSRVRRWRGCTERNNSAIDVLFLRCYYDYYLSIFFIGTLNPKGPKP